MSEIHRKPLPFEITKNSPCYWKLPNINQIIENNAKYPSDRKPIEIIQTSLNTIEH